MQKQLFILTMLLLSLSKSFAQLNESDTAKFQLRASLTGNYQQGNVDMLNIRSRLDFTFLPNKNWVLKSENSSLYQSFFSVEADNDIFSRNYIYFKPQQKVHPFAIAYISTNYRRKVDNRYFAGLGAAYQIIKTNKNLLTFAAGAVYEETKFTNNLYNYKEYNGDNNIKLFRGNLYVGGSHYFLEKHIRLYYDAYWQPAFKSRTNYRTQVDIGINFPAWKGLSFNTIYSFTHENLVVEKVKQEDQILTFGIAYNLKVK